MPNENTGIEFLMDLPRKATGRHIYCEKMGLA